ncbi:MAG: beta-ketoacyl-ACP synthase 3 [Bilifractor sp.]|jgi:3-oxoacyl-[acyl-carrier-protein] synthase-3
MEQIRILTTGGAEASKVITNDMLSETLDTSDEWIFPRTGIHERRVCAEGETTVTLATAAADDALKKAAAKYGIQKEDIGCVIVATMSGDYATPSTACMIQQALGLPEQIPVFDVNAACSGFIYALTVARCLLAANGSRYGLIVGAEQLSKLLDWNDRSTCILFGDGAGAVVVEKVPEDQGVFGSFLAARGGKQILAEGPGKIPSNAQMDGKAVFRFAVEVIPKAGAAALKDAGIGIEDVDYIICHQANSRIIDHFVRHEKLDPAKVFKNIDHMGNTSAASIPVALHEMDEKNMLKDGQTLLLIGFGGGLTYGGVVLTFGRRSADEKAE